MENKKKSLVIVADTIIYNIPKKELTCIACGYSWNPIAKDKKNKYELLRCPNCKPSKF